MNSELYIPTFVNSVDCAFYGRDFPYNQHREGQPSIPTVGKPFDGQRHPTFTNQLHTSIDVNHYACNVNGMNFNQQKNNLFHNEIQPFSADNCDSSLAQKEKRGLQQTFVCEVCGLRFSKMSSLTDHSQIHTGERLFPCEFCNEKFVSNEELLTHLVVHSQERRFECDICCKKFTTKQSIERHRLTHTGEKPHVCQVCQKAFSSKKLVKIHMIVHTEERPFSCEKCEKKFKCRRHLTLHMAFHAETKPYLCEICSRSFYTAPHLKKHQRVHTGEKPYSCPVCPVQYSNRVSFKNHVRSHDEKKDSETANMNSDTADDEKKAWRRTTTERGHDKKKDSETSNINSDTADYRKLFVCNVCKEEFLERCELKKHELYHKREKPFACFHCGVKFFQSPNLKVHLYLIHRERQSTSEVFFCKLCDRSFRYKKYLRAHSKIHAKNHSKIQFVCDMCGRTFKKEKNLLIHTDADHFGKGRFPCAQCGKRFFRPKYLLRHLLYHTRTNNLSHQCTVCSKKFVSRYLLKMHAEVHTGKKSYACPVCQTHYSAKDCLLKHVRGHGDEEIYSQVVEMFSKRNVSSAKGNESDQNEFREEHISVDSGVKAVTEHLKSKVMSSELSLPIMSNLQENTEASHFLSSLANLVNRFVNHAEGEEPPQNLSSVDSVVKDVVSQLVETTVEKSTSAEENPVACVEAEERNEFALSREKSRRDSTPKSFDCGKAQRSRRKRN